ncbi:hypothetical protein ACW9HR_37100 [Nocardia gipuzkoensis]
MSIDIEPGGQSTPVGYIGICEVGCDGVGTPTLIRFRSPLCQYSWEQWVTSCEDQLIDIHQMRSEAERERLQGRWDISDDIEQHNRLFGFSPLPDPFDQAEYRRPEPATFSQVWSELAPRLAGTILTAYNAAYDRAALYALLQLSDPHSPVTNYRWIDGLAVARHYKYWQGRYGSPTEKLWRELFDSGYSEGIDDLDEAKYACDLLLDYGVEEYLEHRRHKELEQPQFGIVGQRRGERLQDVALRLELFTSDEARLRALAHREWGIGNKPLLRDAAEDAWANAEIIAAALHAESLPVTTEGIDILDAVIVDPDPTIYPAHQPHLAAIDPVDPLCAQFLTARAQAQIDRCIQRICGIQLTPMQWTEVYEVWEAAARWLPRLAGVTEGEHAHAALAAEANRLIEASRSVLVNHQRGKVYANALSNWLEANRKKLAFQGHTDERIEAEINRLRDEEEHDRVQRRRKTRMR